MKYFILAICSLISFQLNSQNGNWGGQKKGKTTVGKISGILIHELSEEPVEFATVMLRKSGTEKDINGTITDEKGEFKIDEVETGTYDLVFSFIGFNTKVVEGIELTLRKPDFNMKEVTFSEATTMLNEINVTAKKAMIENKVDRIVYNAEGDPSVAGGDATDLLRKVPLLTVDIDGNVSLRGSTQIKILINGKPSGMFSANVADALKMIPSDQIKSVEVITTPSAKYDGEGTGGIINIITKRKSVEGFSGSANTTLGTRLNSGGLSLNAAKGRFGLNGSGRYYYSKPIGSPTTFHREDRANNTTRVFDQIGETVSSRLGFGGQVGAFYEFNAFNSINSNFNLRGHSSDADGFVNATFVDPANSINQVYERSTLMEQLQDGFDWNIDFTNKGQKENQEITIAYQLSGNNSETTNDYDQMGNDELLSILEKSDNDGINLENTLQVDITRPIGETSKVEFGAKGILRKIDSDYIYERFDPSQSSYIEDLARSNNFNYEQDVYAGYLSFNFNWDKIGIVAGARYENTSINGEFNKDGNRFDNSYDNILPSFIISTKLKDYNSLKFSYTQRIQRPSLFYINPFTDRSDNRNVSMGNPNLAPELAHQVELGYTTFVKGTVVNTSIYYRRTSDIIESFLRVNNEGVSETTYRNIGVNNSYGFNVFSSFTVSKILTLRGNVGLYTFSVEGKGDVAQLSNNGVNYKIFANGTLNLKNGFLIDGFGFFNSPRRTLQGSTFSFSMFSIGFKKEVLKKRGYIGMRFVEPFSKYKEFNSELEGPTFSQATTFKRPFRSIGINLEYKFGKLNFKKVTGKKSKIRNDDQKSGDGGQQGGQQGS